MNNIHKIFGSAKWIGDGSRFVEDSGKAGSGAVYLRREFEIDNAPEKFTVNICGLGLYELYLNGKRVGDQVLEPAFTDYDKRVLYTEYNLKSGLFRGKNTVEVVLGDGFYNQTTRDTWGFYRASWRDAPKLLFRLVAGDFEVVSDESWQVSGGEIVSNAIRLGEVHDFTAVKNYRPACLATPTGGKLVRSVLPPIRECETLNAVCIKEGDGCIIYDFGRNISGYAEGTFEGERGEKVRIVYTDRVKGGREDNASNSMYISNADGRYQTDELILSGGVDRYKPSFVYHGFRYALVYGRRPKEMRAHFVHTDLKRVGNFECGDGELNTLYSMTISAVLSNYHGFPTDCPHREKNGWTGDAQLSSDFCVNTFDMAAAYEKWLDDMFDAQRPSGQIPAIIPTCGWGYNWGSGPAWDYALFALAEKVAFFYGRRKNFNRIYMQMQRYFDYISDYLCNDLLCVGLGDWNYPKIIEFPICPTELTDSLYFTDMCRILSRFSEEKGDGKKEIYDGARERTAKKIREKYAGEKSLTGLAALDYFGVLDTSREVVKYLDNCGYRPHFGILGNKFVFGSLEKSGRSDVGYKILKNHGYPSFLYFYEMGQTALCEDFELTNSLNHHMFSPLAEYMVRGIVGLKLINIHSALLSPSLPEGLNRAKAGACGFEAEVVCDGGEKIVKFKVPAGGSIIYKGERFAPGEYVRPL